MKPDRQRVVDAYVVTTHDLLDAVTAGRTRTGLPRGADLRAMNERDLLALPAQGGPERVKAFGERARD
ncbi:MAG: hypothetical protein ACR2MA_04160 [Egibacteraceae bacterium]